MQRRIRVPIVCLLCLSCLLPWMLGGCRASASSSAERNEVTAVIPDGKGSMRVEAVLTQTFLENFSGKKIYLFEVPAAYTANADLTDLEPIAECKPDGKMTFTCSAYDGVRSRLYSSYLIACYDAVSDSYTALTSACAVNDFSDMGQGTAPARGEVSIKGLISDYPADADRLGVAHTIVDVYLNRLILDGWQEGAETYIWNGLTAYLNGGELDKLDETVRAYTKAGIRVYLRFLLGAPGEDDRVPLCLYLWDEGVEAPPFYTVNMEDDRAVEIMKGFLNFMADRYASPEDGSRPVDAFIMGKRANRSVLPEVTLEDAVSNYEKLVRAANTAMKSHCANGRVYIALDASRTAEGMAGGWDVPSFLSAFHRTCGLLGSFDWQVACELYADTPAIWTQDPRKDGPYYTVHSLATLTDLLVSDQYRTADGAERRVIISDFAIPATVEGSVPTEDAVNLQAASYAYAYLSCVQNGHVEALIYSDYTDRADRLCGLWARGKNGYEPRTLYYLFKQMDTTAAAKLSESLTAIMDRAYTQLELSLAGRAPYVTAVTGDAAVGAYEAGHLGATPLYAFDTGTLHGFEDAGSLTYAALSEAEALDAIHLYARFDRAEIFDPMGLTVTLSASEILDGKKLILDLYAGAAGQADAVTSVTLRLNRPATGFLSDGQGELLYESTAVGVKDGTWQTVAFEVSDFTTLLDGSDSVVLTISVDATVDGESSDAAHIGLAGIYLSGKAPVAQKSPGLVIGVVIALSVAVIAAFLALFLRNRKRG